MQGVSDLFIHCSLENREDLTIKNWAPEDPEPKQRFCRSDDFFIQHWFKCEIRDSKKERCDPNGSFLVQKPDCNCESEELDYENYNDGISRS